VGQGGMNSLRFADKGKDLCLKEKNKQILPCLQALSVLWQKVPFSLWDY